MGRYCAVVLLLLSIVCFALFWSTDFATSALARHVFKGQLEGFFQGDCSKEGKANVHQAKNDFFLSMSSSQRLIPPQSLSGMRLKLLLRPFTLEDNDDNMTFIEMGPLALKMEMEGRTTWIMRDPFNSNMTVEEPINNVDLLVILIPLMAEQMVPGLPPGTLPEQTPIFENKSIIDRVNTAQNITENIMQEYNYTGENSLKQIHLFLSAGSDAALEYNGSNFKLGRRQSSPRNDTVFSLPPLSNIPAHYSLPGFEELSLEYLRSNESGVAGLALDKYTTKNFWNPSILCHLTNRYLLNLYKKIQKYLLYLTAPGSIDSKNFNITTSGYPLTVTMDVYRPFGLPVGGSVSVQVNFHIPQGGVYFPLQGDTIPVVLVTATLEQLPDKVTKSLFTFIKVRTGAQLAFLVLSCLFLVAAMFSFISYRRARRYRTWTFHNARL
ncbi:hypothetical protein E2C01_046759 [Portunus trituberculatus]|uniref:Uncharacterized protein n=1 Tax=Portunus trituberculatus TaxID=210409 RepID=A0A5B7FYN0_PORTR|nr:hypothetical protein [Portunus trituberculatus]